MAKNETYLAHAAALSILMTWGDFTEAQARIVLGHMPGKRIDGADYFEMSRVYARARENKNRPEIDANTIQNG